MDPTAHAAVAHASPPNCSVTVSQLGNETYASKTDTQSIFIDRASQTIAIDSIPASGGLTYNNNGLRPRRWRHIRRARRHRTRTCR
jgi:hypothetical protein